MAVGDTVARGRPVYCRGPSSFTGVSTKVGIEAANQFELALLCKQSLAQTELSLVSKNLAVRDLSLLTSFRWWGVFFPFFVFLRYLSKLPFY